METATRPHSRQRYLWPVSGSTRPHHDRATVTGQPRPDGVEIDAYRYAIRDEAPGLLGTPTLPWLSVTAGWKGVDDVA